MTEAYSAISPVPQSATRPVSRLWALLKTSPAHTGQTSPSGAEFTPAPKLSVLPFEPSRGALGAGQTTSGAEQFSRWALAHCVFRDGCYGGVAALHKHLCAWCVERGRAVPSPSTFGALLADEGFTLTEFGLVYGLLLREDWEAAHAPPPPPAESKRVAPRKPAYREALPWKA